jgi:hypothetical protein
MNINLLSQHPFQPTKPNEDSISKEEYECLKTKFTQIYMELEEAKIKSNIKLNEAALIESSAFKAIVDQSEFNITLIDQMKDIYLKLKSKYDESYKEYEMDLKRIEDRILKSNDNYKKKYQDVKEEAARLSRELEKAKFQIEELSTLKHEVPNFDSCFKLFDEEKKRLIDQLSKIMKMLSEQREKYDKEVNKSQLLIEENFALKTEIDNLKQQSLSSSNNLTLTENVVDEKSLKYKLQELSSSLKHKKEKLLQYEKKYSKIKEELTTEKEINTTLLNEIETNEKGLTEMNSELKQMKDQISNENQKIAKLTKEKINDQKQIEKLSSEREINKQLVELHKTQKKALEDQLTKLEDEITVLKGCLENTKAMLTAKDKELVQMDELNQTADKKIKEAESLYEQEKRVNKELLKTNASLKAELESGNNKNNKKNTSSKIFDQEKEIEALNVSIYINYK